MTDDLAYPRESARAVAMIELGGLTLRSERDGTVHTIGLAGELDMLTAGRVQDELERVETGDAASIVLDLSELTFMDSTGVRLLVTAHARTRNRLTVVRGRGPVQRVIELTGVDELLPLTD